MMAASKPTSVVSQVQDNLCYTEHQFWDLNSSLPCSGLGTVPYAPPPLPVSAVDTFRVGKEPRTQKGLQVLSVLYHVDEHTEAILRHNSTGTSHRQIR